MSALQETLLSNLPADVWSAHTLSQASAQVVATGEAALDTELPGGGWPVGVLVEILQSAGLHSEWRLLLPALARCGTGPVVLVGTPQVPFAPSLQAQGLALQRLLMVDAQDTAARLWSAEQALRCAPVDAVLLWLPQACRPESLRRLHLAAAAHHKLLWAMRPRSVEHDASPAPLRVAIELPQDSREDAMQVQVLKRRGPPMEQRVPLRARPARLATMLAASRGTPLALRSAAGVSSLRSRHALAGLAPAA